jgi:hypothetical protein
MYHSRSSFIVFFIVLILGLFHINSVAQVGFKHSLSASSGIYAAAGLGSNVYVNVRYNHLIDRGTYFFEGAVGFGSIRSDVLESVTAANIFDGNGLFTYEFLFGYDWRRKGTFPYIVLGFGGINQGGQSRFAGVIGLGKRILVGGLIESDKLGLRYDIRDQIFSQELNNSDSFISHNIVITIGIEYYF